MKKHLLQIAQECPSCLESAMALAESVTTAESVEQRVQELTQSQERDQATNKVWDPVCLTSGIGFIAALIYFAITEPQNTGAAVVPYWPVWVLVGLFVLTVVGLCKSSSASERLRTHRYELEQAVPMAAAEVRHGKGLCEDALRFVAGGREPVLAWRDLAIAERGQLYAFDVEIMGCIDYVLAAKEEAAANDAVNAEAFQLVHSIGR